MTRLHSKLVDDAITVLIITVPILGTFFPVESYIASQDFGLEASQSVSHASYFTSGTLVFYLLLFYLAFLLCLHWRAMGLGLWWNIPLLAFVGYVLLSSSWSYVPGPSFNRGGRLLIVTLYAVYFVQRYDSRHLIQLLTRGAALATAASIVAIIVVPDLAYSKLVGYQDAWRGAMGHKNALGAVSGIGLLISLYSLKIRANRPTVALFVLVGSILLLIMARSATAGVAAFATIGIGAFLHWINQVRIWKEKLFLCLLLMVSIGLGASFFYFVVDPLQLLGREGTLTGRAYVWDVAHKIIGAQPIWGYGHGFWSGGSPTVMAAWQSIGWATPHAHNTWLDFRIQLGMVGLVLAIVVSAIALWRAAVLLLTTRLEGCVLWCMIIVYLGIRSIPETLIVDPDIEEMFWFALAYASFARMNASLARVNRENLQPSTLLIRATRHVQTTG